MTTSINKTSIIQLLNPNIKHPEKYDLIVRDNPPLKTADDKTFFVIHFPKLASSSSESTNLSNGYIVELVRKNPFDNPIQNTAGRIFILGMGVLTLCAIAYGMTSLSGLNGITNHIQMIGVAGLGIAGVGTIALTVYGVWRGHRAFADLVTGLVPFTNLGKAAIR